MRVQRKSCIFDDEHHCSNSVKTNGFSAVFSAIYKQNCHKILCPSDPKEYYSKQHKIQSCIVIPLCQITAPGWAYLLYCIQTFRKYSLLLWYVAQILEKSIISTLLPLAALVCWTRGWSNFWKQASRSLWPGSLSANEWLSTSANYRNSLTGLSLFSWVITVSHISLAPQITGEIIVYLCLLLRFLLAHTACFLKNPGEVRDLWTQKYFSHFFSKYMSS